MQQLFKYVHHDEYVNKIYLLLELLHEHTGLEDIEVILKYIINTVKDIPDKEIIKMVNQAIPDGASIMGTLGERWKNEGKIKWMQQGIQQGFNTSKLEGKLEGKLESIKTVLKSKFGRKGLLLIDNIRKINNPQKLDNILEDIVTISTFEDLKKKYRSSS